MKETEKKDACMAAGITEEIHMAGNDILHSDVYLESKHHRHHFRTNVSDHSMRVAVASLKMCRLLEKTGLKIDEREMIRGALLHDYFQYDLHDKSDHRYPHRIHFFCGLYHPGDACRVASARFDITPKEADIITHHMWPLTVLPPHTLEGWVITLTDKYVSTIELMSADPKTTGLF
jgi:uncharacterized protein